MSLGYQKGRFWFPDDRYAAYSARDSYQALMRANVLAGFGTDVTYSHNAQTYMAEIITLERFASSNQIYIVKHNNAYDANPMAALTRAIRESGRATPYCLACCLEIECELLRESLKQARDRDAWRARVRAEIDATLDALAVVLDSVPENTLFNRMSATSYDEDDDL